MRPDQWELGLSFAVGQGRYQSRRVCDMCREAHENQKGVPHVCSQCSVELCLGVSWTSLPVSRRYSASSQPCNTPRPVAYPASPHQPSLAREGKILAPNALPSV